MQKNRLYLIGTNAPITFLSSTIRGFLQMSLTNRERKILELSKTGLSDYSIAHQLNITPSDVTRSHKKARKKLARALSDIEWAESKNLDFSEFELSLDEDFY